MDDGHGAMAQHSSDDKAKRQLGVRALPGFLRPTSANDNTDDGPWPLIPFPNAPDIGSAGQEELSHRSRQPDEVVQPTPPVRTSRRATLGLAVYVVAASIAVLGWLYFIWIMIIRGVLLFIS